MRKIVGEQLAVLRGALRRIQNGGCECGARDPNAAFHTPNCTYRIASEAFDSVSKIRTALDAEAQKTSLMRERIAALETFVSSFHMTVVDNTYKDVSLHLEQPHAISLRLPNSSDKSWIYADFEQRRQAALGNEGAA